jgi:putative endonuclease
MSHYVYIIYSVSIAKFYVGEAEDVELRLQQHIDHLFIGSFTTRATDWELKLKITCENRNDARIIETYIKKMKSKVFLFNITTNAGFYEGFKQIVGEKLGVSIIE